MQPTTVTFSGHESFPFRNTWLTKGVTAFAEDPTIFSKDEAMVILGVGKNMVQSIRHWCLVTRMLEEDPAIKNNRGRHLRPTAIARRLFITAGGWDRYLEDTGTLWLIHWLLATNSEKATTWYYAFNELNRPDFSRRMLEQSIAGYASRVANVRASQDTLKRDVDIFVRTYVGTRPSLDKMIEDSLDCPLSELGLIFENPLENHLAFARGPKDTLPDEVIIYALSEYARGKSGQRTLSFEELAYGPMGPGRVFRLDEASLAERLDRLGTLTDEAWQFTETAGYKQVLLTSNVDPIAILGRYYQQRFGCRTGDMT